MFRKNSFKITLLVLLVAGISLLHYLTFAEMRYEHTFYRLLFYVPLILSAFWYGLKGSLIVCMSVLIIYTPYMIIQWHGLSPDDFDKLIEGVLFVAIALLLGVLMDREKRQTRALLEAESMAAVGRAVSEVAHDMKTPLMAIGGFASQVTRQLPEKHPQRRKLDIVVKETARLEEMVKSMLEFSRSVDIERSETDLSALVRDSMEVLRNAASEAGVELVAELSSSLGPVQVDQKKIQRVLQNVITNAVQASPQGERVKVTTSGDQDSVLIEITDHGPGIGEDQKESVFHPFFTTKKSGTGLGLGIAKKIVETHGGKIFFRANQNLPGVTFTIMLPFKTPA